MSQDNNSLAKKWRCDSVMCQAPLQYKLITRKIKVFLSPSEVAASKMKTAAYLIVKSGAQSTQFMTENLQKSGPLN
jgi:hypothetical protein